MVKEHRTSTDPIAAARNIDEWIEKNKHEVVELLQQLIRVNTVNPPGNEDQAVSILRQHLDNAIWDLRVFEPAPHRSNLVATLETGKPGPTLLCTAHLDTVGVDDPDSWVSDPFSGQLSNGHIVGRGAVDHKSPVAALIFATKCLTSIRLARGGRLILVFDADEEAGGLLGAQALYKSWDVDVDMVLYSAPSSWGPESRTFFGMGEDNVITGSIGAVTLSVESPEDVSYLAPTRWDYPAENAVRFGASLMQVVRTHSADAPAWLGGRPEWRIIDTQEGGALTLQRRILPGHSLDAAIPESINFVEEIADQAGVEVRISVADTFPAVECPKGHELPRVLAREAQAVTHRDPYIGPLATVTGMSRIWEGLQAPCTMFGYGQLEMAHATNERISVVDLLDETKVYARTLATILNPEH